MQSNGSRLLGEEDYLYKIDKLTQVSNYLERFGYGYLLTYFVIGNITAWLTFCLTVYNFTYVSNLMNPN